MDDSLVPAAGALDRYLSDRTAERIRQSVPENTQRAYARQLERFTAWCAEHGRTAFEIVEDEKPYREWCVPAELLNGLGNVELLTEDEVDHAHVEGLDRRVGPA